MIALYFMFYNFARVHQTRAGISDHACSHQLRRYRWLPKEAHADFKVFLARPGLPAERVTSAPLAPQGRRAPLARKELADYLAQPDLKMELSMERAV